MPRHVLITGGCGFLGHHLVEHTLKNTDWHISIFDRLTYASRGFDRLRGIKCFDDNRVRVYTHDIRYPISVGLTAELGQVDYILHVAAETHVDNSIIDPEPFVTSNVLGTMHMLNYARTIAKLNWFVYFSTDEVFGPAPDNVNYKEWDRYNSTNPYSASKAGGEELCLAWANTYKLPIIITHCMNLFGERQHPEKFIPNTIRKVLNGQVVTIHSNSNKTRPGSRFYFHARNAADGVLFLLGNATNRRDKYNLVGQREVSNLELATFIADFLGRKLYHEMVDFHSSRPGHDLRYALDGTKMADLGWAPPLDFETSLLRTIRWYLDNPRWFNG